MDGIDLTCTEKVFRAHECADGQEGFNSGRSRQIKPLSACLTVFHKGIKLPADNEHHDKECYLYRPSHFLGIKPTSFISDSLPGFRLLTFGWYILHGYRCRFLLFYFFQLSYLQNSWD